MTVEGSGPEGPGPSSSDLERARLRMYVPGASIEDVAAYERLSQLASATAPPSPSTTDAPPITTPVVVGRRRGPVRPMVIVASVVVVVLALIVAVALPRGPEPLPDFLNPPAADGRTITTLGRLSDPRTAPGLVTYQPQGYTVFQPEGHAVRVRIRCQGVGSVVIAADRRFRFQCTGRRSVQELTGTAAQKPFVVVGTTRGNVVWAVRIMLV